MKKQKLSELKDNEILSQLEDARKDIRQLRFDYAITRSFKNPKEIRTLKKKVARLLTVQRERQIKAGKK